MKMLGCSEIEEHLYITQGEYHRVQNAKTWNLTADCRFNLEAGLEDKKVWNELIAGIQR